MNDPIYFNDDLVKFREKVARFVREEIVPYADQWELAGKIPRELFKKAGALGLLGLRYSKAYGGSELNAFYSTVLSEELGKCTYGGVAVTLMVHNEMASPHLGKFGNQKQKEKYLHKIISGDMVTAVAITEPNAGSDVAGIQTRAVKDGAEWVINGSKIFITNGVYGDLFFVAAKTDLGVKPSRGVTMFIVEPGMAGFSISKPMKKMGWLASDTAELSFDNLRVPEANILGELNQGFYSIMKNFQHERLALGGMALGESQKALELTLAYVKEHGLWEQQSIRHRISGLYAEVEALRQLVYYSAWLDSQGKDCVKETSMVKALCGEFVNKVTSACVEIQGEIGCLRGTPVERMFRDAHIQTIGGGATEVMVEEIAKRL